MCAVCAARMKQTSLPRGLHLAPTHHYATAIDEVNESVFVFSAPCHTCKPESDTESRHSSLRSLTFQITQPKHGSAVGKAEQPNTWLGCKNRLPKHEESNGIMRF